LSLRPSQKRFSRIALMILAGAGPTGKLQPPLWLGPAGGFKLCKKKKINSLVGWADMDHFVPKHPDDYQSLFFRNSLITGWGFAIVIY
jgi:hypothetical protein